MVALLNDSVGTLAGGAYEDPNVKLGIILGTGTNACYMERVAKLGALDPEVRAGARPQMLVNTEWGNFWADSLPITRVRIPRPPGTRAGFCQAGVSRPAGPRPCSGWAVAG